MIKMLQKKFIVTAMAAISILLIILVGGINFAYWRMNDMQTDQQLDMLAETEGRLKWQEKPEFHPGHLFERPIDEDTAMSLRFFIVSFGKDGQIVRRDITRIASVSREEAEIYARQAAAEEKQNGHIGYFKYRAVMTEREDSVLDGNKVIIFLDVAERHHLQFMVFLLSIGIAVICWAGMFLLVVFLSRRAILPLAQNIQKQKQFVTDAGHEIKTPLAIIQANIDAMELINGENKWIRNIRSQTVRLNGLMQNLLTLAKMDEISMELPKTNVNMSELIEESLRPFSEGAALRGISIETDIWPEVFICADYGYMQRLLSILFDNAVKYADQDGIIWISLSKQAQTGILQVKNTCSELPEADPDRLFDRFYRADRARTQKNGGYGIGLSAAYAIVEAHKGSIQVEYADKNMINFIVKI